jgi:hypothetical protein
MFTSASDAAKVTLEKLRTPRKKPNKPAAAAA